ncbi:aminotransferase class IV [Kitasatospora kifunensis]|uniref:Branched-subunit amino acid aminotransferase/4-amino-4-deoxychorismate lyase n=1 Tax=Kitasatospora kifunensis TaxID=58351 RepID=A0A7W7R8T9_KITKI|nr:aminotransferase class IV [Kitasatospora kifunensis]MBB4927444.1 branched-subunit amino acid aminotransferase/4-amino-4-deoxychorismate lyase [Kitasatospora kifunensis]
MATVNGAPASLDALQTLALTNYGHFTTMRVADGAVRGLSLHLDRLVADCRDVFGTELDPARVLDCVRQEIGARTTPVTVRVTVFDPALDLAHPGAGADPAILVTTRAAGEAVPPPLRAKRFTLAREAAAVKHVGLFNQLRLRRAAQLAGFDDALFVEPDGRIAEGGTWNIGFVAADGTVVWPEAEVLPGVTMRLLQAAHRPTVIAPVPVADLPSMRAAFATNAAIGVRTVCAIDEVTYPTDDPVLEELRQTYARLPGEPL